MPGPPELGAWQVVGLDRKAAQAVTAGFTDQVEEVFLGVAAVEVVAFLAAQIKPGLADGAQANRTRVGSAVAWRASDEKGAQILRGRVDEGQAVVRLR